MDKMPKAVQPVVAGVVAQVVDQAKLEDATSVENQNIHSNKHEGSVFIKRATADGALSLVIAGGSLATSVWYDQVDATNNITPA